MQPALTGSSRDCVEFRPSSAGLGPPGGGASSSAGLLSTKCKRRCRALSIVRLRARGPSQEGHSQHLSHSFSDDELELTVEDSRKVFCYGCGVKLQTTQPGEMGYIEPEKYATKLEHRQYTQMLCERCISLCHGKMVPAVDDRHQKNLSFASSIDATSEKEPAPKVLIAPEELRRQLKGVRHRNAVILLLVDLLDIPGSWLSSVRDLVGKNPIILIGTKLDLLPRGTTPLEVKEWLEEIAHKKGLNVHRTHLVSSKAGQGVEGAASILQKMRRGRDVYVMGAANVGKSAFVRALLQEMRAFVSTSFDPAARSFGRFLPTESEMPGTTLGIIPLQAFSTGGTLYDTPGVHLFHRVPHILSPGDVRRLHPRKKLRPYVPPTPLTICSGTRVFDDESPVSATYLWGTLARIDVVEAPRDTTLVFYGPQVLKVRSMRLFGVGEVATADDGCEHVKEIDQSNNKDVAPAPGDPGKDVADRQLASAVNPHSGLRQDKDHGTITSIWGSVGEEEVAEVKYVKSQAESELISSISNSLLDAFKESELLLEAGEPHTARPAEAPAGCTKPARSRGPWHEKGSMSTPPGPMFGEASVEMCGGLTLAREVELDCSVLGWRWPDITVSGVPGWISVLVPSGRGRVVLRMWTPRGVEAFIRTPIPVPLPLLNAGRD